MPPPRAPGTQPNTTHSSFAGSLFAPMPPHPQDQRPLKGRCQVFARCLPGTDPLLWGGPSHTHPYPSGRPPPPPLLGALGDCSTRAWASCLGWACSALPTLFLPGAWLPPASSSPQASTGSAPGPGCPSAPLALHPPLGSPCHVTLSSQPTRWFSAWEEGLKELPPLPDPWGLNLRKGSSPCG